MISRTGSQCLLTIKGHQQAVWAVLHTKSDLIVTGSADKTIKVHKNDGSLIKTLTGTFENVSMLICLQQGEYFEVVS